MKKEIYFPVRHPKDVPGICIVPVASEDDLHEYSLEKDGGRITTGMFSSMERAKKMVKEDYPNLEGYEVRDITEEWYVTKAFLYRNRIKELHPSFKKSDIILDVSRMIYSRSFNNWHTYIPFTYKGQEWKYIENAGGDGIEKVPCKKQA